MKKKMKKLFIPFFILCMILLAACGKSETSSSNGEEKTIKLKYASIVPETHDLYIYGAKVFMEKVEELGKGKVEIEFYPDGQLGSPADMINLANSGAADLVELGPSYIPGKLVLGNVFQLPGALPDAEIGSKVIWDVFKDEDSIIRKADFTDNKLIPLLGATLPLYQIVTTEKKPLKDFKDLEGLKLRSAGGAQDLMVKNLGAVPVSMDRSEVYTALERGTLDGGVFNLPSLEANKTIEVMKNLTTNANVTSFVVSLGINEKKWSTMPEDVKDILTQAGDAASKSLAESVTKSNEKALQNAIDKGYNPWTLSADELKELNEMVAPTWDQWVKDMKKLGFDGEAAIKEMEEALKNY
ncbi:TRAP transporter substrate-binding protein DctP [Neobacillus niacini]|uniref:TRAP transporter substrate-binding protein n=1 Tax=Neobacillus niacini TaxID=86668 RepID=UPI002FFFCD70